MNCRRAFQPATTHNTMNPLFLGVSALTTRQSNPPADRVIRRASFPYRYGPTRKMVSPDLRHALESFCADCFAGDTIFPTLAFAARSGLAGSDTRPAGGPMTPRRKNSTAQARLPMPTLPRSNANRREDTGVRQARSICLRLQSALPMISTRSDLMN